MEWHMQVTPNFNKILSCLERASFESDISIPVSVLSGYTQSTREHTQRAVSLAQTHVQNLYSPHPSRGSNKLSSHK